jgi:hypothetical protein
VAQLTRERAATWVIERVMRTAFVVVALLVGAGCTYRSFGDCTVACTAASGCPDGLTCGREGFCRTAETGGVSCATVLEDAGVKRRVTVAVTGGVGSVTSVPAGIDCPGTCSAEIAAGSQLTLTAAPGAGGSFAGWSGACSGTGACTVTPLGDVEVTAAFACTGSQMFAFTGAAEPLVLPACATSISIDARGAAGARATNAGTAVGTAGQGGRVQATIAVTPGDTFTVRVGGAGSATTGGFNGGGAGNTDNSSQIGGGGGGASDVRRNGNALADRIVVAGGGGGAAACSAMGWSGGLGGGLVGGGPMQCATPAVMATGGTQSAGGTGGSYATYCTAQAGALGVGAPGCNPTGAGGGGGGYYGGGGGAWHGGGGGSSYAIPAATAVTHSQGIEVGAGRVTITWM